jgi:hypothetical protein
MFVVTSSTISGASWTIKSNPVKVNKFLSGEQITGEHYILFTPLFSVSVSPSVFI